MASQAKAGFKNKRKGQSAAAGRKKQKAQQKAKGKSKKVHATQEFHRRSAPARAPLSLPVRSIFRLTPTREENEPPSRPRPHALPSMPSP